MNDPGQLFVISAISRLDIASRINSTLQARRDDTSHTGTVPADLTPDDPR
jgi:hypothetical protein